MSEVTIILETVLSLLVLLGTPVVLVVILVRSRTVAERIVAAVLILGMVFYYARPLQWLILGFYAELPSMSNILQGVVNIMIGFLEKYQEFILGILPGFDGITVLGKRMLRVDIDTQFVATGWPIVVLFVGVVVRLAIGRFVRHERLRQVGREYWLFITAYIILALMTSTIVHWSFLGMMLAVVIVVFVLTAGLLRVATDLISGFWASWKVVRRLGKIAMMYVAFCAAKVTKLFRNLVRFIRELYNKYIIEPIRRLYGRIQNFLDRAETTVRRLLNEEQLED